MLKYVFAFILFVYSLIHMMAFTRAGGYATPLQLIHTIPTSMRYTWLLASVLLMVVSLGVVFEKKWWPLPALFAVAISQVLILL